MVGLRAMNQVRVPFIRDGVISKPEKPWKPDERSDVLKGFNILDVGCGGGILSEALAMLGANVVGIDPSEELIAAAKAHISTQGDLKVEYYCELVEDHLIANSEKYDIVVASEVVEHVIDPKAFLKACVAALKPGGSLFVTTISKNWISWFCLIIMGEYVLSLLPQGTHTYDKFIDSSTVSEILNNFDCRTTKVTGLHYLFYKNAFKFSSSEILQYALHAVKQCKVKL